MGIDVEIYVEADGEPAELYLPDDFELRGADDFEKRFGPTHKIETGRRYYGVGYERGYWPVISGVLLALFASKNVKRVWYFGDCSDIDNQQPITLDDVFAISRHYVEHAHRPYRDAFKSLTNQQ